ncbi:MAG: hypothetical protein ACRDI2_00415 [Chloroflexota bacterium]
MEVPDHEVLDASLTDDDWRLVHQLWRYGMTNRGLYALLRLRMACRRRGDPALDGFTADPNARFARWLVEQGRLNEG